jgi:hypothetical protein
LTRAIVTLASEDWACTGIDANGSASRQISVATRGDLAMCETGKCSIQASGHGEQSTVDKPALSVQDSSPIRPSAHGSSGYRPDGSARIERYVMMAGA